MGLCCLRDASPCNPYMCIVRNCELTFPLIHRDWVLDLEPH